MSFLIIGNVALTILALLIILLHELIDPTGKHYLLLTKFVDDLILIIAIEDIFLLNIQLIIQNRGLLLLTYCHIGIYFIISVCMLNTIGLKCKNMRSLGNLWVQRYHFKTYIIINFYIRSILPFYDNYRGIVIRSSLLSFFLIIFLTSFNAFLVVIPQIILIIIFFFNFFKDIFDFYLMSFPKDCKRLFLYDNIIEMSNYRHLFIITQIEWKELLFEFQNQHLRLIASYYPQHVRFQCFLQRMMSVACWIFLVYIINFIYLIS
jgi:hypothetical protein